MKRIFEHFEAARLGHKLHQLQKRHARAVENGYTEKAEEYSRRIEKMFEKLNHVKRHND